MTECRHTFSARRIVEFLKGERLYVQVAYVLADERTREREFGAFEKIRSLDRKLLLTMDRIDMGEGTVKHMYIPDFMVSREPPI